MRDDGKVKDGETPFEGLSQWALEPGGSGTPVPNPEDSVALPEALAGLPFFQESSLVGERIDSWEVQGLLGQGGMAAVYLAEHVWLKQRAALKVLLPIFAKEPQVLQRFQREAIAISQLSHPNIIEVKDFGFDPNHGLFMVMEYLEGQDLESMMLQAPFSKGWLLSMFAQICEGLQAIHDANVLHRDLKPSNLFLLPGTPFPLVKILDFGVAKVQFQGEGDDKLTRTGVIVGTPRYLSPEQIHHMTELSFASDLYALGVVLYECLTGKSPYPLDTSVNYLVKVVKEEADLISVHRPTLAGTPIEAFVVRALAKRPQDRPASAMAFWEEFKAAMAAYQDPQNVDVSTPTVAFDALPHDALKQTPRQVTAYETNGASVRASNHEGSGLPTGASVTPMAVHLAPEQSPSGRGILFAVLGILLCALGGVGWYAWELRENAVVPPVRGVAKAPSSSGVLDGLVIEGRKALKAQKYQKAVRLWKRATKQARWRRSPHYPKLYRAIGVALAKQKKLHSAMVYFRRYKEGVAAEKVRIAKLKKRLSTAKEDLAKRKAMASRLAKLLARVPRPSEVQRELQNMRELEAELKQRADKTRALLITFQARWNAKQWESSLKKFKEIQRRAPSIPGIQLEVARVLALRFVPLALARLQRILQHMEPSASQRIEIATLQSTLRKRQAQREIIWRRLLQEVAEALEKGKLRQALSRLRKALTGQLLANGALHIIWRKWLLGQSRQEPARSRGLWRLYGRTMARLQREGTWSWLRLQDPLAMAPKQAKQALGLLRGIARAKAHQKRALSALLRGDLAASTKAARAFLRAVSLLKTIDPWQVAKQLKPMVAPMQKTLRQLGKASVLVAKADAAHRAARFPQAMALQREALASFGATQSPVRGSLSARFAKQKRSAGVATNALVQGHRAYAKFRWANARKHYKQYKALFPGSHRMNDIEKRLKVCRCLLKIFPWEVCTKLQLPRGYQPPGGR